tara:strand:+ start:180 stop:500 length:321 start_codon:yes stop_codon:yes gene_type:complete
MKKSLLLFGLLGLLNAGSAAACDIDNKREIQVGNNNGVAGECSNNGAPIQCINDGQGAGRFNCDGPEGSYSGPNLQALISTTCGCSANSGNDNDASEQLQEELNQP